MSTKVCCKCRDNKDVGDFHRDIRMANGLASCCKSCAKAYYNSRREKNNAYRRKYRRIRPLVAKKQQLKYIYGLSYETFEALRQSQNDNCAICGQRKVLQVDHDHISGKIRGLLCGQCNRDLSVIEKHKADLHLFYRYLENTNGIAGHKRLCKASSGSMAGDC